MFHVKQKKDEVKRCVMYCDDENERGGEFCSKWSDRTKVDVSRGTFV